jgi:hypothetical protein
MAVSWDKAPCSRIISNTNFTLTTASQATSALGSQTYQVRVATNGAVTTCFVKIGDGTPSATTANDAVIGANVVDYFNCTPGQKVAVIGGTAAGIVSVSEMA